MAAYYPLGDLLRVGDRDGKVELVQVGQVVLVVNVPVVYGLSLERLECVTGGRGWDRGPTATQRRRGRRRAGR